MIIETINHALSGTLDVIPSKSISHRALIASGLARGTSRIDNLLNSEDIKATILALKTLNVNIDLPFVQGGNLKIVTSSIDAFESGSTLRFMIPLALLLDQEVTFLGRGRLPKRPLTSYEDSFKDKVLFKRLSLNHLPLKVQGPIKGGNFELDGHVSSQFLSGLLFALPLCKEDSTITLNTPLESRGYVDLTLDVLKRFGVNIKVTKDVYYIKGNQHYTPQHFTVEGDYSQAAFFMVGALFKGPIRFRGLNLDSKQGDRKIIDIIKSMNGHLVVDEINHVVTVFPSNTVGTVIDLKDIPDLGPILMVLAAVSEGETTFLNTTRLTLKESNRLDVMVNVLKRFGVECSIDNTSLKIVGKSSLKGNLTFDGANDHRIVMALSIAALKAEGPITIRGVEAINKSYPDFFNDYKKLNGRFKVLDNEVNHE